jgi:ArsR family transcriptional regulator, lead/cadmium/zinc/bismuth-responsive transcriptional repressor
MTASSETSHRHGPLPDGLLDAESATILADRFKLLADPSRLRIVNALIEGGELCVNEIATLVTLSESATSHQLRQLRLAGLVRSSRQGREVFYRVADSHVRLLIDLTVEHYLHEANGGRSG